MNRHSGLTSFLIVGALTVSVWPANNSITINGAGATFPAPIYSKWFDSYHEMHPDIHINYQAIGSGGGIRQMIEGTVDFGASDGPMTDDQLKRINGKLLHIPTVLGAVVPTFNVSGLSELKLTGSILADIYLGKIMKWNDPVLATLNPGVKLPDQEITVIHRADGSGTSFCFTDYLSKISSEWKAKVGSNTSVEWPVGLGGKGNDGVAELVKQTSGSIGYVELVYVIQNKMPYAAVQNKAGNFIKADFDSVSEAAASIAKTIPSDFRVSITDAPSKRAYPISTFTWLLILEKNPDPKGRILKEFLNWMLDKGQATAKDLDYAPLPANVKAMVKKSVKSIQ
jgi:phosphate transport system substrate-binding protein